MSRRWLRVVTVIVGAVACTAGPVVLPREAPAPPAPCAERRVRADVADEPFEAPRRVLGRSWVAATDSDRIRWFDPVTLRRTDEYLAALPEQTGAWAVSSDGRRLAISLRWSIRVIDVRTLGTVASVRRAGASVLAWVSDRRLAMLSRREALTWDARSGRVRRARLVGSVLAQTAAPDRLLAVTGADARGPAAPTHLVEVGRSGVRSIPLDRIVTFDGDRGEIGLHLTPALAYDPVGRRAFVVPSEGPIAVVELTDGTVGYQPTPASFVNTIATAFLPAARAKLAEWETVRAVWLGDGLLAVSGETGSTMDTDVSAAGVSIVDTRTWTACLLDPRPTRVALSDGVLLAWGGAEFGDLGGTGLVGYDLRDGDRWHLFGRQYLDVQLHGGFAYAINSWHGWRVRTVELSTGEVVARRRGRPPTVLPTGASAAW